MKALLFVLLAAALAASCVTSVQAGRLDGEDDGSGSGGNQTANQTSTTTTSTATTTTSATTGTTVIQAQATGNSSLIGKEVLLFFSDERLYGFAQPSKESRRLGNEFDFHIVPLKGQNITYKLLFDNDPVTLNNGQKSDTTSKAKAEHLEVPALRRTKMVVELKIEGKTYEIDYGLIRLRTLADVEGDSEDDELEDEISRQIRTFTSGQFTWYTIQVGAVSLGAIMLGIYAGVNKAREAEEQEETYVVGF